MTKTWMKHSQEESEIHLRFPDTADLKGSLVSSFLVCQTKQAAGVTCQLSRHHPGCHTDPSPRHTTAGKAKGYRVEREWDKRWGKEGGQGQTNLEVRQSAQCRHSKEQTPGADSQHKGLLGSIPTV